MKTSVCVIIFLTMSLLLNGCGRETIVAIHPPVHVFGWTHYDGFTGFEVPEKQLRLVRFYFDENDCGAGKAGFKTLVRMLDKLPDNTIVIPIIDVSSQRSGSPSYVFPWNQPSWKDVSELLYKVAGDRELDIRWPLIGLG